MFELAKPTIKISDLMHRIALCSMQDVVQDNGTMALTRKAVTWIWARIDPALNLNSFMSQEGYSFRNPVTQATHRVIIRAHSGLEITSAAWVYEQRRKSPPRWYKCLGFTESDAWILIPTHLMERSDNATPPVGDFRPQPSEVTL
jgi:hypothetical protein